MKTTTLFYHESIALEERLIYNKNFNVPFLVKRIKATLSINFAPDALTNFWDLDCAKHYYARILSISNEPLAFVNTQTPTGPCVFETIFENPKQIQGNYDIQFLDCYDNSIAISPTFGSILLTMTCYDE
jgi:hypothetical protein